MDKIIRIGFGVMVLRKGKVLLGRRHDDPEKADSELHGEGSWTMPSGKLHFGETLEDGAVREVFEETGFEISTEDLKSISLANDIAVDAHFISVAFLCENSKGEPDIKEPDEITEWGWFELEKLPIPIFPPSQKVLDNYHRGEIYHRN